MGKKSFYLISGLFLVIGGVLPWMAETGVDSSGRTPDRGKIIIEDRMISAELKNMPLGLVLRQVEKQGNTWTRGDERIFKEKVNVSFKYLSLEEGLDRILSSVDYRLVFNKGRVFAGVVIAGRSKPGRSKAGERSVTDEKRLHANDS
ncbi:MAG TPA: hypothetical protein DDW42_01440 [Desulfobacteraceae bacterium]|nr:hypothetical protein [Desulfobacteraceae bacterium]